VRATSPGYAAALREYACDQLVGDDAPPDAARASADCQRGRARLPRSRGSRRESRSSRR
jgi:hypothetical protein